MYYLDTDSMTLTNQVDIYDGLSGELGRNDKSSASLRITLKGFYGELNILGGDVTALYQFLKPAC